VDAVGKIHDERSGKVRLGENSSEAQECSGSYRILIDNSTHVHASYAGIFETIWSEGEHYYSHDVIYTDESRHLFGSNNDQVLLDAGETKTVEVCLEGETLILFARTNTDTSYSGSSLRFTDPVSSPYIESVGILVDDSTVVPFSTKELVAMVEKRTTPAYYTSEELSLIAERVIPACADLTEEVEIRKQNPVDSSVGYTVFSESQSPLKGCPSVSGILP
jgi:hypothetical protein